MLKRQFVMVGLVLLGLVALVLAGSGCASLQGGSEGTTIPHSINKHLTQGYSIAEAQKLDPQDRKIYDEQRHNDVYPEHKGTLGVPGPTPAGEGRLWHWEKP